MPSATVGLESARHLKQEQRLPKFLLRIAEVFLSKEWSVFCALWLASGGGPLAPLRWPAEFLPAFVEPR